MPIFSSLNFSTVALDDSDDRVYEAIGNWNESEMWDRVEEKDIEAALEQIVVLHTNAARYHAQLLRAIKIWGMQEVAEAQKMVSWTRHGTVYATEQQKIICAFLGIQP